VAEQDASRTEQATGRRKSEARKKGQIALSREVPTAAVLAGAIGCLYFLSAVGTARLVTVMQAWLARAVGVGSRTMTGDTVMDVVLAAGTDTVALVLPIAAGIMVVGVASYGMQTGLLISPERLAWDLGRLNPIAGLSRLFSWRSAVELVKAVLKVGLIAAVGVLAIKREFPMLPALAGADVQTVLTTIAWLAFKMSLYVVGAVALLAAADYGYQRFEWERSLRMTKEEVKQEHKETEGDPVLRSRIRSVQRSMARKRMMAAVPKADVVITNPTHIAVALRYDQKTMVAPVVVAKGAGFLAEKIKEIAKEHHVMIVENKFIARTLYALVEIGREIPSDLYRAVAEILAMVYRAKGKLAHA
jgi:flagellar biosynthetic protein FlhB